MERQDGMQTTRLADNMAGMTDAWSRAAKRVREQAMRLGLTLDEEALVLHDIRELHTLAAFPHRLQVGTATRRTMLQGLRAWVRAAGGAAPLPRRA